MNLVDHIGKKVSVYTLDGPMLQRTLRDVSKIGITFNADPLEYVEHEVFVPWHRIKDVVLLSPKPPSPEFIAKAAQMVDTLKGAYDVPDGGLAKDAKPQTIRAQVGDIVREDSNGWYIERDLKVERVYENGVDVTGKYEGSWHHIPHGMYTIIKRAEDYKSYECRGGPECDGCACEDTKRADEQSGISVDYKRQVRRDSELCLRDASREQLMYALLQLDGVDTVVINHSDEPSWNEVDTGEPIYASEELRVGFYVWDTEHKRPGVVVKASKDRVTLAMVPYANEADNWYSERCIRDGKWEHITKSKWMKNYHADAFKWLEPSTAELVEMLSKREGVDSYNIPDPEHVWQVRWMDTRDDASSKNWTFVGPAAGPAQILVVRD